jgi:aquaporin Z
MLDGDYLRRAVAEFVGVFALVFVGAGSLIYQDVVAVALAYGLAVAVMVSSVGLVSGGHFNPAVTLGLVLTRRIAAPLAALYLLAQLGAAALAALLLRWVLPAVASSGIHVGAPAIGASLDAGKAVTIEAVLTFFLVWVFFATAVDPRGSFKQVAGLAIGFTVTLDVLMGAGLTGAMMNPARAFGPQLVGNHWSHFWVWYVGPLAGGALAALAYEILYLGPVPPAPVGAEESGLDEPGAGTAALP